jgi:hypothetical protein
VVQLSFNVKNIQTGEKRSTKIFLGDLRGSQTNDISLGNLGEVFAGVSKRSKAIPFNGSALTNALKDGLQGKSLMLLTVSGANSDQADSLSTLQFAAYSRGVSDEKKKK